MARLSLMAALLLAPCLVVRADVVPAGARPESAREGAHDAGSRFPLTGEHRRVGCDACHGRGGRTEPLDRACGACHEDPHSEPVAGSAPAPSSPRNRRSDCGRCHGTSAWQATVFRHEPPFTRFTLGASHDRVGCEACHPAVEVSPGVTTRRYTPVPSACESCHPDRIHGSSAAPR
jgi:hypothetical protein